ncbi:hypothetical protein AVEN_229645-1 [Araneus ventricosus]|uniref:Uncharacterized protein n=1 Tax=Araneus ventricosus TaxID=182803 RepID=A0A4Y2HV42_ARAVE|nr:hypothetical protein AVEN_229645-1 [Araneus ventricosus]
MAIQNSHLSASFVNEVVKFVEDETIIRGNLKSVSDVYSWIEEYRGTSDTKWNLRSSRPSGTRLVCCTVEEKTDIQELVGLCNEADNNNYRIAGPSKNIPSPFKSALFWLQKEDDKRKKRFIQHKISRFNIHNAPNRT